MLTYLLNAGDEIPLYEQLYKLIKADIAAGRLGPNEKLPSRRTFAVNLGVSTMTVENAYAQLSAEGYIYTLPKRGYFVSDIRTAFLPEDVTVPPTALHAQSSTEAVSGPQQTVSDTALIADFTSNQTVKENFPFSIWSRLIRELLTDSRYDLLTNAPAGGAWQLRQAIADHLHDYHGMNVSPQQVIIGAGTEYLYGILIQLLGFDLCYGVEDPGYRKISRIYGSYHVKCDFIPMDDQGVMLGPLNEKGIDVIHVSPSHQFPTGITMPAARRYGLLAWAAKSPSRYIIEDDYDSDYRLTGQTIPPLQSIDSLEKVIYINTFTRTLSSTVRISYMVLPPHLLARYDRKMSFYSCTVSNFEQYTLAAFISRGYFEKHINRTRNDYRARRNALVSAIRESEAAPYVNISGEDAGLHFLLRVKTRLSDEEFCKRAKEKGILVNALSGYYKSLPENVRHIFVIGYAGLNLENLAPAVDALCGIIRQD